MAKPFKSGITKPTDAEVFGLTKGRPFVKCPECGIAVAQGQKYCPECERLYSLGMKTQTKIPSDTQAAQSYPSDNNKGYQELKGGK